MSKVSAAWATSVYRRTIRKDGVGHAAFVFTEVVNKPIRRDDGTEIALDSTSPSHRNSWWLTEALLAVYRLCPCYGFVRKKMMLPVPIPNGYIHTLSLVTIPQVARIVVFTSTIPALMFGLTLARMVMSRTLLVYTSRTSWTYHLLLVRFQTFHWLEQLDLPFEQTYVRARAERTAITRYVRPSYWYPSNHSLLVRPSIVDIPTLEPLSSEFDVLIHL